MELFSNLEELAARAVERGRPYATNFLAAEELEKALAFARKRGIFCSAQGGTETCERARLVLLPDEWFAVRPEDFVRALRIAVNDGARYSHRDYLGSIMALGIERDTVGDIIPAEGGAIVYVLPTVAEYLLLNLQTVSRTGCRVAACGLDAETAPGADCECVSVSVSSLRCDCVASALFHLSREACAAMIERGLLRINGEVCLKPDRRLELPARLALKGHGMAVAEECGGTSRKGKLRLSARILR